MIIKGWVKNSLIDYPGKISTVLFLPDCNFRCPFCQNPDFIKNPDDLQTYPEQEILDYLSNKRKWIDAVVFTGGEPTLHKELPEFIKKIKELGFLVKLDTNGSNPDFVKKLLKDKLLDYLAMDLKGPLEKYEQICKTEINLEKIKESIEIIKNSGIEYEMRSTILPKLHDKSDVINMAKMLRGMKIYFLQNFRADVTLDPKFQDCKPFTKEELEEIKKECGRYVSTDLRG